MAILYDLRGGGRMEKGGSNSACTGLAISPTCSHSGSLHQRRLNCPACRRSTAAVSRHRPASRTTARNSACSESAPPPGGSSPRGGKSTEPSTSPVAGPPAIKQVAHRPTERFADQRRKRASPNAAAS